MNEASYLPTVLIGVAAQAGTVKRWLPEVPWPAYSYVPGVNPHPEHVAPGSSAEVISEQATITTDPKGWRECRPFLLGVDLFNAGFYWEAHEAWEALWHALGRTGPAADWIKGLIKLAAAGVKLRERRPTGVQRHASRAAELFGEVSEGVDNPARGFIFGLNQAELHAAAAAVKEVPEAEILRATPTERLNVQLRPS